MENITFEQFTKVFINHIPTATASTVLNMYNDMVAVSNGPDDDAARLRIKLMGELSHDQLVEQALNNPSVMGFIAHGQKVQALKALRDSITDKFGYTPTLLATKNAIDDIRVTRDIRDIE